MSHFLLKLRGKIFKEKLNGREYIVGGLLPDKKDERDFVVGGWFGYTPKHKVSKNKFYSTKNQRYNTCGQEAMTGAAECREKCELSEQSQTILMYKQGKISGDGFSSLKSNLESVKTYGIAEKFYAQDDDYKMSFNEYATKQLSQAGLDNAKTHRSQNYFSCPTRASRLEALDNDEVLYTGMNWYSGWNMANGFCAPWIIKGNVGYEVGGHAVYIPNYDLPRNLYIVKNSCGEEWGGYVDSEGNKHEGCFAVDMDFFDKEGYQCYKEKDLEGDDLAEQVGRYEGKDVKATGSGIFRIMNGQKYVFPDDITFYAYNGKFGTNRTWVAIAQSLLDRIPYGGEMDITQSPIWEIIQKNWETIKRLQSPQNFNKIDEIVRTENAYWNSGNTVSLFDKINKWFNS